MAASIPPLLWTGIALVAAPFAFWALALGLLATPLVQRQ